jgi:glutamine synthetase
MRGRVMIVEKIRQEIEEKKVMFIRLQISDIFGMIKNVEVPVGMLDQVLNNKIMFDGSSIDGYVRIDESDMYLRPDLETFAVFPWNLDGYSTARFICDVYRPNGKVFEGDPRSVLKRVMKYAQDMGFNVNAGPEPEFFLFKLNDNLDINLHDHGSYFDLLPVDFGEETRREIVVSLEKMGFEVEAAHHEVAPSQHEIDFKYTNALKTADNIQTFKLVVKTIALFKNLKATFIPKPVFGINGSGMHIHLSLEKDGENAFYDKDGESQLSKTALSFIAGILEHAKSITAITNPIVNSYKRLVPGYEAPVNIAWATGNRSALIRIPQARKNGTRLEYRSPDPTANPYLALALLIYAGLDGVKRSLTPPKPVAENIFDMTRKMREEKGVETLPADLHQAIENMKKDPLIKEVLGEHIYFKFIEAKEKEWEEFCKSVTNWEIKKYMGIY